MIESDGVNKVPQTVEWKKNMSNLRSFTQDDKASPSMQELILQTDLLSGRLFRSYSLNQECPTVPLHFSNYNQYCDIMKFLYQYDLFSKLTSNSKVSKNEQNYQAYPPTNSNGAGFSKFASYLDSTKTLSLFTAYATESYKDVDF